MILVKTEGGQQLFKDRSVPLTPRQRSAYILCDGKRSVDEVLQAGMGLTREDIDQMVELGLLGPAGAAGLNGAAGIAATPVAPASALGSPAAAPVAPAAASANAAAAPMAAVPPAAVATPNPAGVAVKTPQQRYQAAYPIATQLAGSLGLRGFRLNLSVEGTTSYEQLLALYPKIEAAVGAEKAAALKTALSGG